MKKNVYIPHTLRKGFILPMAMLLCAIILTVSVGITTILAKEIFFSQLSRESQLAYYAADTALECASFIDDGYIDQTSGTGIFPTPTVSTTTTLASVNDVRTQRGLGQINIDQIKCATSPIFDSSVTGFAVTDSTRITSSGTTENTKLSTFYMTIDAGDGKQRCARVSVNKSGTWRQIIAQGFNTCNLSSNSLIERAVVSTSEIQ